MEVEARVGDHIIYSEIVNGRKRRIKTLASHGTERVEQLFAWLRSVGGTGSSEPTRGFEFGGNHGE